MSVKNNTTNIYKKQYHHLTRDDRNKIESLINQVDDNGKGLFSNTYIANYLGFHKSTISRELKNRIKSKIKIRTGNIKNKPYNAVDAHNDYIFKRGLSKGEYKLRKYPKMNICQMDTVEGKQESTKCLLTIIDTDTHFMFIRLLDKKDIKSVNSAWDTIKNSLEAEEYSKLFRIVLTDNGSEFFDPMHIETDYNTGKKLSNVFYCKPYSSWQKGCIEKNHESIRKVFPKGTSFDDFDENIIKKLEDNINNTPRHSLKGKTPYHLFNKKYTGLTDKLNCSFINPDNVTFNERDYK